MLRIKAFSVRRRERGGRGLSGFFQPALFFLCLFSSCVVLTCLLTLTPCVDAQVIAVHSGIPQKAGGEATDGDSAPEVDRSSSDELVTANIQGPSGTRGEVSVASVGSSTTGARAVTALRLSALSTRSRAAGHRGASTPTAGRDSGPAGGPDVVDSSAYEWLQLSRLTGPSEFQTSVHSIEDEGPASRQDLFEILDLRVQFGERPAYVMPEAYQPFIDRSPRPLSRRSQAIVRLARKEFYRHVRRMAKKEWRHRFRDSAWSYDDYIDGVTKINQLGRAPGEYDSSNVDYFYNVARNDVLDDDGLEGERELTLLEYGPFGLNDRGSLEFDLWSMARLEPKQLDLSIAPDDELKAEDDLSMRVGTAADPVYRGSCVRVRPNFRVRVDPFRALGDNPDRVLRSYGGSLEIGFFSDILKRKLFSLEGEVKVRRNEEYGFFFNFVIEGWR